MKIEADFEENWMLPAMYTCDGDGIFPRLSLLDIPVTTKSLALIVDDPDAPAGTWTHLLLVNIPVDGQIRMTLSQDIFEHALFGQNSRWELARWAPCPPSGVHRYVFKVYALDEYLDLSSGFSKERLLEMMWGKILAQAQITWLYQRK